MKFFVSGDPVGKGSATAFNHATTGRIIVRQSNASKLYPWQQAIGYTARENGIQLTSEPVVVNMSFFLKRPKKPLGLFPSRPDLDKLVRSVLDALSGIAYYDDRQVISIMAYKMYETKRSGIGVEIEVL